MKHVSVVEAKSHFSALIVEVESGEEIAVTDNEREFRRVPGLRVENWLAA